MVRRLSITVLASAKELFNKERIINVKWGLYGSMEFGLTSAFEMLVILMI